ELRTEEREHADLAAGCELAAPAAVVQQGRLPAVEGVSHAYPILLPGDVNEWVSSAKWQASEHPHGRRCRSREMTPPTVRVERGLPFRAFYCPVGVPPAP